MVTYYVKQGDICRVSATVQCKIYDANDSLIGTCEAGDTVSINAKTSKIKLSDNNATLARSLESTLDLDGVNEHLVNNTLHVTQEEKTRWNGCAQVTQEDKSNYNAAYNHSKSSDVHITTTERQTWNGKANASHTHNVSDVTDLQAALNTKASTSDITNLQNSLNGKASTSDITNLQNSLNGKASSSHNHNTSEISDLDVGVKRIDYWTGKGAGVTIHSKAETLIDASSFSNDYGYKATKDVCLIYTVGNSPGSGYADDFKDGFYYNYPLKLWMDVKVNGTFYECEAAKRRVCSGGIEFIEVHLKAGDEVKFSTASVSTYTGYVRIKLLEYNYR